VRATGPLQLPVDVAAGEADDSDSTAPTSALAV
jgi:hypothetical protein